MNQHIKPQQITRRHFVVSSLTAAGGLAIAVGAPGLAQAAAMAEQPWSPENPAGELTA
ncbi:MAG: hypothetical protein JO245_01260, partial [Pseudolabrys sp.]|nr:hypothetical protein [Pseudolabrys sp.]